MQSPWAASPVLPSEGTEMPDDDVIPSLSLFPLNLAAVESFQRWWLGKAIARLIARVFDKPPPVVSTLHVELLGRIYLACIQGYSSDSPAPMLSSP